MKRIALGSKFWFAGFTLIELLVVMTVMGTAVLGVYSASSMITQHSADPLFRTQALAIAQFYMEEIRHKEYELLSNCPSLVGRQRRSNYTHICHYSGLTGTAVQDQFGDPLHSFSEFSVDVALQHTNALGPFKTRVPSDDALVITVKVRHKAIPFNDLASLTSYRTRYGR